MWWYTVTHGRGDWQLGWVASTLHTTSEHGVSSITTADAHTSAASSRLNWRPRRLKWTRPFRRKTKYGFSACAITLHLASASFYIYAVARYYVLKDVTFRGCHQEASVTRSRTLPFLVIVQVTKLNGTVTAPFIRRVRKIAKSDF